MSGEKIVVVSADGHAGAGRMADFAPYVDPKHRSAFEDYVARVERYDAQYNDALTRGGAGARGGEEALWDFAVRERQLDDDGLCAEVLFIQGSAPFAPYPAVPGRAQRLDFQATPEQVAAGCRAYNRWLADQCSRDPRRFLGIAILPIMDVDSAVAEVEFAASIGLRGGAALPVLSREEIPYYNDARYEPLWAACEAHGTTLNIHGGANLRYGDGPDALALVLAETDWFGRRGLTHMIFSGVFERHPNLHLALTEQRTHWLQPTLKEYDSIYAFAGNVALRRSLPRKPSEYFASNCFVGASFMSRLECEARGDLGSATFMWGADYPHEEGCWPYTREAMNWTFGPCATGAELRQMLGLNAARCYGLDMAELQTIADRIGPTEAEIAAPMASPPRRDSSDIRMESWAFRREGAWN